MADTNSPISRLINAFSSLPSIGKKSAERLAYHVLKMPNEEALEFAESIRAVKENLKPCRNCFNLSEDEECVICEDPRRDQS
ncbi:MAG: recombination protein RecR, partial [Planctomycetaceae bacterium]|nr:recombination protein RecR [Planctomycetaceae bacterium]